jgi:hypothetical protein
MNEDTDEGAGSGNGVFLQRAHVRVDMNAGHERRKIAHDFGGRLLSIGLRLRGRNAGFETPYHLEPPGANALRKFDLRKTERHPKLGAIELTGEQGKLEIARHDPDYDVRFAVQEQLGAEDLRIAVEAGLPHRVTKDRQLLTFIVFLLREEATEERLYTERRKYRRAEP